ncbi:hypothetical protein D3C85_618150 [compost metagenome]
MVIALLGEDAGLLAHLLTRAAGQAAQTTAGHGVGVLAGQGVAQIEAAAIRHGEVGAHIGAEAHVAVRDLALELEPVVDLIFAAEAETVVGFPPAVMVQRRLDEGPDGPGGVALLHVGRLGIGRVAIAERDRRIGPRALAGRRHVERAVGRALALLLVRANADRAEPARRRLATQTDLDRMTLGQATVGDVALGLKADRVAERHVEDAAVLIQGLAKGQLAGGREARLARLPVAAEAPVALQPQFVQLTGEGQADGVGLVGLGLNLGEVIAAGGRQIGAVAGAVGLGELQLHEAVGRVLIQDVGAEQILRRLILTLMIGAAGDAQTVGQPVLRPPAGGEGLRPCQARRILIGGHDPDRVPGQRRLGHEAVRVRRHRRRVAHDDPALKVVHLIVAGGDQFLTLQHQAGILVADFQEDPLRPRRDVAVAEEVDRAPGRGEVLAAGHGAGVGGEAGDLGATLAARGHGVAAPVQIGAVQGPLVTDQLIAAQTALEHAPQGVGVLVLGAQIEAAIGRGVLDRDRVVAIDRIVHLRVDAAQQRARVLFQEAVEQAFQRLLAGVGRGRQAPVVLHHALEVEGQTTVDEVVAVIARIAQQFMLGGVEAAAARRDVGDADEEAVGARQDDLPHQINRRLTGTRHLHRHGGGVGGHDLLDHEAARAIHRNRGSEGGDARGGVLDLAAQGDGGALDRDGVDDAHVLEQGACVDVRLGDVDRMGHVQRQGRGLVVAALGVIDAQDIAIAMLARLVAVGRPQDGLAEARRNDRQRRFLGALIGAEDANLGPVDIGGVVAEGEEAHGVAGADHRLLRHDAQHRAHVEGRGLNPHVGPGQGQVLTTLAVGAQIIAVLPCPIDADTERTRRPAISGFQVVPDAAAFDRRIVRHRAAGALGVATAIDLTIISGGVLGLSPGREGDG